MRILPGRGDVRVGLQPRTMQVRITLDSPNTEVCEVRGEPVRMQAEVGGEIQVITKET